MDIASTSALPNSPSNLASTKRDTSVAIALLNKANQIQSDSAKQLLSSIQQSTPSVQALPDHLGRNLNVTA